VPSLNKVTVRTLGRKLKGQDKRLN
jgi:hypothetical protein